MICESSALMGVVVVAGMALLTCCDRYPPKMIPGCHIFVHTSAATDYDARLLLRSIGIPFDGKLVD